MVPAGIVTEEGEILEELVRTGIVASLQPHVYGEEIDGLLDVGVVVGGSLREGRREGGGEGGSRLEG